MNFVTQQIFLKSAQELPGPALIRNCQIDSDGAVVSHAGLIHVFKLPMIGEYAYNFKVYSNTMLYNHFKTIPIYSQQGPNIFEVDCILNYIESVSLCIDSPEGLLSQIDNISGVHQLQKELIPTIGSDLTFLVDLPLITGGMYNSDIYLVIKFRQKPAMRYFLCYDVGFIANENIIWEIRNADINIPGRIISGGITKNCNFRYQKGKLSISS